MPSKAHEKLAEYDETLRAQYGAVIVGVDEAGRGALAGPLAAGAVIFPVGTTLEGVNDSKKLTAAQREALVSQIKAKAIGWAVEMVEADEVDANGLTWANGMAMLCAAREALSMAGFTSAHQFVIDQFGQLAKSPAASLSPYTMASKMDSTSLSVAAASILAKTQRDALMASLAERYPGYGLEDHKGYVNPAHNEAVLRLGRVRGLHRFSYNVRGVTDQLQLVELESSQEENK